MAHSLALQVYINLNYWGSGAVFLTEDRVQLGLILSSLALVDQAPVFDSKFFDRFSPFNDNGMMPEVGVGGWHGYQDHRFFSRARR